MIHALKRFNSIMPKLIDAQCNASAILLLTRSLVYLRFYYSFIHSLLFVHLFTSVHSIIGPLIVNLLVQNEKALKEREAAESRQ